jgi:hypothetical protein
LAAATPEETAPTASPRDRILETAFRLSYAHDGHSSRPHPRLRAAVREWARDLADSVGAPDPAGLSRALTLMLGGGLSAGVLDADPEPAQAAKATARTLVEASC